MSTVDETLASLIEILKTNISLILTPAQIKECKFILDQDINNF